MTNTNPGLTTDTYHDVLCVVDPAGGVWWPCHEAQMLIADADDPHAEAIRIASIAPNLGEWVF